MAELRIALLGSPSISRDGQPVAIARNKSMALCAYLALHDAPCRRDKLAALFWPELGQARARADLRRELAHLRQVLGPMWLVTDREMVALHRQSALHVDVLAFRQMLTGVKAEGVDPATIGANGALSWLADSVALYRGDFLDGFSLRDAPEFDTWQYFTAEELRRDLAWALGILFKAYRTRHDLDAAREVAQRRLALDPLDEAAHQALIELYLQAGQRSAALRQYEQCVRVLQQEVGAPPCAEIQRLGAAITSTLPATTHAPAALAPAAAEQPARPDDEAEIRIVVALSLSILPRDAAGGEVTLERLIPDSFGNSLAEYQERLRRGGAWLVYCSAESTLALFGLPASSEDDAERCLHCAFDLRASVHGEFTTAIGVASGLAYVKPDAASPSSPVTVIGPVLNLAADLQRVAGAGEILVDQTTCQLTSGAVRYGEAEAATVHGRSIVFHRALHLQMEAEKSRGLTELRAPLIGRAGELACLQAALHKASAGDGQVIFLSGEAGLGKSRLVAELKEQSASAGAVRWLAGRCRESTASVGYWPFAEMVRLYLGWRPDDGEKIRAAAIEVGLAELTRAGHLASDEVEETAAVLGALYTVHFGDHRDDLLRHADPSQIRHRTVTAMSRLFILLSRQQPLVLVLEDLHWADALSLDLIRDLLSKLTGAPLLLICIYRPEERYACVRLPVLAARRAPGRAIELRLCELTGDDTAQLIDALMGRRHLPADLHRWILERAQGNPFFVEESIRALIESGMIVRAREEWRMAPSGQRWLPDRVFTSPGVDSLILSRVGRLDADLRKILRAASVLGVTFASSLLATLLPEASTLEANLHELEQHDFLLCERAALLPEYSFRHVLLREAVYKTLPPARRAQLHRQAAQAIETHYAGDIEAQVEQLAQHYAQTDDHAAAVRYLVRAGAKARRAFLNEQARTFFELALQRCTMPAGAEIDVDLLAQQADIWQQLGRVEYAAGAYADAEHAFRRALECGEAAGSEVNECVHRMYWLGEALYWQDKTAELESLANEGLARLSEGAPCVETVLMLGHLTAALCAQGRRDEARHHLARLKPLVQQFPFSEELSPAYHHVIDNLLDHWKDVLAAQSWIDELAVRAAARHDLNSLAKARYLEVVLQASCGDMASAKQSAQQMLDLVRTTGERTLTYFCVSRLAELALFSGDLAAASAYGRQILASDAPDAPFDPLMVAQAGYVALGAGELDAAVMLLQQATADWDMTPSSRQECLLWLARAQHAAGQTAAAAETYKASLMLGRPSLLPFSEIPLYRPPLASMLAGLDATLDDAATFRTFCDALLATHPDLHDAIFRYWALSPATPSPDLPRRVRAESFTAHDLPAAWQWCDPRDRGTVTSGADLEIHAAEGCDLWHLNFTASRLLTTLDGDFAIQATCAPATCGLPMGGLCLWGDTGNFLRLDRGALGPGEVSLMGCITTQDCMVGRGRLPGSTVTLRLERQGIHVRGLCSVDGQIWWLVGECEWPWQGCVAAGPFVVGLIDRTLYPAAPPHGGGLQFSAVQIWRI